MKKSIEKRTFDDRDEFSRQLTAEKIIKILQDDYSDISPLAIDGQWGSGKTEFCHKLIDLINNPEKMQKYQDLELDFTPIYLDAYKYDHSDDPFLMLVSIIANHLEKSNDKTNKTNLIENAIPIFKALFKITGRATVSWVLKESSDKINEELAQAITDTSGEMIDSGIKGLFKDYENIDKNILTLKVTLQEIAEQQNIVIFIDELDRCKPNFALSLLEKIKHIFDVKGIQFVFVTNMEQLGAIVKRQYGDNIDAEEYLSKFFNFKVQLLNTHNHDFFGTTNNSFSFLGQLLGSFRSDLAGYFRSDYYDVSKLFKTLFEKNNRTLRDAEKYARNLKVFYAIAFTDMNARQRNINSRLMIMLAVYIFSFYPTLAKKILNNTYVETDVNELFGINKEELWSPSKDDIHKMMYALFVINSPNERHTNFMDDGILSAWKGMINELASNNSFMNGKNGIDMIRHVIRIMQFSE